MLSTIEAIKGKIIGITIADKSKTSADDSKTSIYRPAIQLLLTLDGEETSWSNQDAPVRVSIPYIPKAGELKNLESIVLCYMDAKGNIITIPNGYYDQGTGRINFRTKHFGNFGVAYKKIDFKDVKDDAWYYKAVSFMSAREITKGTGNDNFSPDSKLTRGQFITMMMRAYDIEANTNLVDNFSDAGNTWYTGYLARAKMLGISDGVGNNMFAPDKEITRQEMFTLLYNTLRVIKQLPEIKESEDDKKTLLYFEDGRQIASWAIEAMNFLVETGTVNGNLGKLTPLGISTRAEMSQVLYNLMTK